MSKLERSAILIMGTLLSFSAGCFMEAEPGAEPLAEEVDLKSLGIDGGSGGSGGGSIISGNGANALTPTIVSVYTPLAKLLSLVSLTGTNIELNELLSTVDGRTFLHYLVKCALPAGESVTAHFLGVGYTFPGHVGVAPEWASGALTTTGRRWVSACVLAHVNATTTSVSILLRGDHPVLSQPLDSAGAAYTLREGAFYGDLFDLSPLSYACPGVGTTGTRVCTNSVAGVSPCGFLVPGNCRGTQNTCEGITNSDYYTDCHSGLILPLLPTTAYPETITIYLQP